MPHDVFLARVNKYSAPDLDAVCAGLLEQAGLRPGRGDAVLVKPNLVAPSNVGLTCTHPLVVRAVCRYLADFGCRILVGDSPAFGTARIVARACGLDKTLAGLPVTLTNFNAPRRIPLTLGGSISVASQALDADLIVNLPRFKVHDQMFLTLAVKNFFGAVTGLGKPLAHQKHGEKGNRFESMIMDVCKAMPPSVSLMDGIAAMHVSGPAKGKPFPLGLLGSCADPVALDAALHAVLRIPADASPLGKEAARRGYDQSANFPLLSPDAFSVDGFTFPACAAPVAFKASRFIKGRLKALYIRLRGCS